MRIYKFLFISCAASFAALCLLHYFSLRPLWFDERMVFLNINGARSMQVLGQLKNDQAFPRAYLIAVNILAAKFNYGLLSLRFLPLISMLLAFGVWVKIYEKEFLNRWQVLLALFSFGSSYFMSYYAAELKHYSMDVLVMGIFCLYLIYQRRLLDKEPSRAFVLATLLLPFTLLFSYSGFFVFWLVLYNFLFLAKKRPKILALLAAYAFICLLFIIFVFYFDSRHTLSNGNIFSYWKSYFLCTDSLYCFGKTFWEGLRRLSVWWFGNSKFFIRFASPLIPVFLFSLLNYRIKSIRKNKFMLWDIDALGLVIFAELFIFGIMKKYPFTGERITLFFAPLAYLLIIKGIASLRFNKPLYFSFNVFYIVFLISCSLNCFFSYLKLYLR